MLRKQALKEIFLENSSYKLFLLSVLITGLSYGLYKGMLDNFLAEVVQMGEMGRGVTEFFRELPGIALLVVSDNSASGAALLGRTEEQQKQYDYGYL